MKKTERIILAVTEKDKAKAESLGAITDLGMSQVIRSLIRRAAVVNGQIVLLPVAPDETSETIEMAVTQ